jgi:O-antigen/teichoic acid export membrane protein
MTVSELVPVAPVRSERAEKLAAHLRLPLHRNGYALVMSTFSTAALGALYWAIAANRYSSAQVGINASLVSTMMFLTNLASLNFTDVLNRFVPVSGRSARRLVLISYAIAVGLGGLTATIFVLGLHVWAPWLASTLHGSTLGLVYVVAVMLWVVFVLQDAVLVGLRRATYVLVENTGFGIAKIVLLLAFAAALPRTGIFLSWTAPLLVVVVVVNLAVFRNLLPQHEEAALDIAEPISTRHVSRFLGADYVASLFWSATIALMPIIVLQTSGASSSAYVYLSWTIAYTLYLVTRNLGMALTTEGAHDPSRLAEHTRATLTAASRIVIPLSLVLAVGAPWLLKGIFHKPEYATHATSLLRLFALSAIPAIVPITFVTVARVQRRLAAMVVVTAVTTLPVLVLAPLLTHFMGIAGVGLAWLIVQSVVAVVLLSGELRPHWRAPLALDAAVARFKALVGVETGPAPTLTLVPPVGAAPQKRVRRAPSWWPMLTLGAAVVLWVVALLCIDPTAVGSYGLLSAMPIAYFAALAVLTIGFAFALSRNARLPVLLAHVAVFALVVHATPSITYGALRYAWAWKHVGIVDLIHRHHAFTPGTPVLPIYQQWPGFFSAATALTEATGLKSALSFAAWAPPFFELLDAAVLVVMLRGLTQDRRRIMLAVWFFLVANWIGQDYFAPQAFGFFLFLAVFAIVLRWYRRPNVAWTRVVARSRDDAALPMEVEAPVVRAPQRRAIAVLLIVLMVATVTSHPLTPFVVSVGLIALTMFRVLDRRWPAVTMVGLTGLWLLTGARNYAFGNLSAIVSGFGHLGNNVDSNLANLGQLSSAQHVVANMGRMVVVLMVVLAAGGLVRRARLGHIDRAALLLCVAPLAILAGGSYGGEAIFRVYLFALPFAAFLAAGWFFPAAGTTTTWRTPVAIAAVSAVLIAGFSFAYFGKESWSDFSPGEVRAAQIVFSKAPPNSLLIDGTLSYPTQFENTERFTYVTLGSEPAQSLKQVLADPVAVLHGWMADSRFAQGYLIITRSQIAEANGTGVLPRGALDRIERLLLASHSVTVLYHDRDALLVTVERPTATTGTSS